MSKSRLTEPTKAQVAVATIMAEDVWNFQNGWTSEICDCSTNMSKCCLIYWCFPCYMCVLADRTNEYFFTPLCMANFAAVLRTKLRTAFRIKGTVCGDCVCALFCPCCTIMQITTELESQGL